MSLAELRRRHRPGRIVEQVAAGLDLGDVLCPRSAGSSRPSGRRRRAGRDARPRRPAPRTRSAGPGCWRGRCCARRPARPCGGWSGRTAGWRDAEPEPLTLANLTTKSLTCARRGACAVIACIAPSARACVISSRNFCMSQAPVGQRSAQRPQCRQTSSSLAMMRPVFSDVGDVEVLREVQRRRRRAGARSSASGPLSVKVMQSIGQMSTQASHSMQSVVA